MRTSRITLLACIGMLMTSMNADARQWTLRQCIDYALANNITLQKTQLQKRSAMEDVYQSQAALLPSLSANSSQNVTYRPWPETGRSSVLDGYVQTSVDKTYYNGSYGVNANWTVWNGGRNVNTVKLNKLTAQQAALDSATTANQLIEQIAQLYVQILYTEEAIKVNQAALETSIVNENTGKEFFENKKMSQADLAQLTAQRAQDEYNVVEAESNVKNYKRQLRQLLQLIDDEEFELTTPVTTDEMALKEVPMLNDVYASSLEHRPEIQNAKLGLESSDVSIKLAKAQRLPTVGVSASAFTSTSSMSDNAWGKQLKNNFDTGAGVSLSIPIFDNRQAKTAINKAKIQRESYMLDLKDKQISLYSTIEEYWLQAVNNQNRFKAAKASTESAEESYRLVSEKFKEGMINTVELMQGRDKLLSAQQSELQSKYLTILNLNLLNFYQNGEMK
ncbi:MAG: TolC family protein [Prevotella sp.]|nr:TolC family protein [Prevotella sp.]